LQRNIPRCGGIWLSTRRAGWVERSETVLTVRVIGSGGVSPPSALQRTAALRPALLRSPAPVIATQGCDQTRTERRRSAVSGLLHLVLFASGPFLPVAPAVYRTMAGWGESGLDSFRARRGWESGPRSCRQDLCRRITCRGSPVAPPPRRHLACAANAPPTTAAPPYQHRITR
jgi:hypothetical protein